MKKLISLLMTITLCFNIFPIVIAKADSSDFVYPEADNALGYLFCLTDNSESIDLNIYTNIKPAYEDAKVYFAQNLDDIKNLPDKYIIESIEPNMPIVVEPSTNTNTSNSLSLFSDSTKKPLIAKVQAIPDQKYTGEAIEPEITVVQWDGTVLIKDVDYIVSYSNNIEIGTAGVYVSGTGNYSGYISGDFNITETGAIETPEPTTEPTPEPTEEPTPIPTEEPEVTELPAQTEEPIATETPEPTEEPTPEPTEEPYISPVSDPLYVYQWSHVATRIESFWEHGITGEGVKVGIIDTGFNIDHEEFANVNIEHGLNICAVIDNKTEELYDLTDDNGHGTNMLGVLCAETNNGLGIAGLTDKITVFPYRVEGNKYSYLANSAYGIIKAIEQAVVDKCDVVNISMVTLADNQSQNASFEKVIAQAAKSGMIICAGAGNSGYADSPLQYPATSNNVVGVGGMEPDNCELTLVWYREDTGLVVVEDKSSTPEERRKLREELGVSITGTRYYKNSDVLKLPQNSYKHWDMGTANESVFVSAPSEVVMSVHYRKLGDNVGPAFGDAHSYGESGGTSSATVFVTAAAVGVKQMRPETNVQEFKQILKNTSVDLDDEGYDIRTGWGMVNYENIYNYMMSTTDFTPDSIGLIDLSTLDLVAECSNYTYNEDCSYTNVINSLKYTDKDGNEVALNENFDYTVEGYRNDTTKKLTVYVIIKGTGNYTGTAEIEFTVKPLSISSDNIVVTGIDENYTYTGAEHTPKPVKVSYKDIDFEEGTDYTLKYYNNIKAGRGLVIISIDCNYKTSKSVYFYIQKASLNNDNVTINQINPQTYTGENIEPELTITYNNLVLVKDTDYTVAYQNNKDKGTATANITFKGSCVGTASTLFEILPKSLLDESVTISDVNEQIYTGDAITPEPLIKDNDKTLIKDTDYQLSYTENTNIGTATVQIHGIGNYSGDITKTFTITKKQLSNDNVVIASIPSETYNRQEHKPELSIQFNGKQLVKNTDYNIEYQDNTNVGIAKVNITFIGNLTGTALSTFNITQKPITHAEIVIDDIDNQTYTGVALTPEPVIKDGDTILVKDTDYQLKYIDNTNAGTASIEITGIGNYNDTVVKTFYIEKPADVTPEPTELPTQSEEPIATEEPTPIPSGEPVSTTEPTPVPSEEPNSSDKPVESLKPSEEPEESPAPSDETIVTSKYDIITSVEYDIAQNAYVFKATNTTEQNIKACGIMIIKDKNGVLKGVYTMDDILIGENIKTVNMPQIEGDTAQFIVWDSLQTMKPVKMQSATL